VAGGEELAWGAANGGGWAGVGGPVPPGRLGASARARCPVPSAGDPSESFPLVGRVAGTLLWGTLGCEASQNGLKLSEVSSHGQSESLGCRFSPAAPFRLAGTRRLDLQTGICRPGVPRPKPQQAGGRDAQRWAFPRGSGNAATMDHWKQRVSSILADRNSDNVAVAGLAENRCVWAAKPGGLLAAISPQEVGLIVGQDWKTFLLMGMTIAGKKGSVIRNNLLVDKDNMMDVRSKGSNSRSICIGKTPRALIFLTGKKGVHGGALNQKVHDMIAGMKA